MTFQERADIAVVNKMELALSQLQSELEEIGVEGLDLCSINDQLVIIARRKFAEKIEEGEREVLFEVGSDDKSSPMPVARSYACSFLRNWLSTIGDAVKTLEEAEDAKLSTWVKRKFGDSAKFDFNTLRVLEVNKQAEVAEVMSTIYQVLNYETQRIQGIVAGISTDAGGLPALIRDLGNARLRDERVAEVLNNLLDVSNPKVIDEVINSAELKTNPEYKAIQFMGDILKKRLELEVKDEDWRFLGDEDDGEAAA